MTLETINPKAQLDKIKIIIADWSGVFSDDRLPVYEANMRVLEAHGKPRFTFEEWLPRTTVSPIEIFADHGVTGDPKVLFEEYAAALAQVKAEGIIPVVYPDAKEALSELSSKIPIFVLSSHPKEHILEEAAAYDIKEYFSGFIGSVRDKSAAIIRVYSEERVSKSEAVYMGDTMYDIQAAKKAGVLSIAITTGYHIKSRFEQENPDFIVDSLDSFKNLLLQHITPRKG